MGILKISKITAIPLLFLLKIVIFKLKLITWQQAVQIWRSMEQLEQTP